MMKTITLKTDDSFFDQITQMAKDLNLSKSELIRKSIVAYDQIIYKKRLKEQIKRASLKVREESKRISDEFEETLNDGLERQ